MIDAGINVITQKFVQTGNTDFSEDIDIHRKLMGTGMLPEDRLHTTALKYSHILPPLISQPELTAGNWI